MGGDDIVADWKGDVYSDKITVAGSHSRFADTTIRMHSFRIKNEGGYSVCIGQYYSSGSTFNNNAFLIAPGEDIEIKNVNLWYLGYGYYNGSTIIRVIGTE